MYCGKDTRLSPCYRTTIMPKGKKNDKYGRRKGTESFGYGKQQMPLSPNFILNI